MKIAKFSKVCLAEILTKLGLVKICKLQDKLYFKA